MWVFLKDSALSIVGHRDMPGHLLVRARFAGDIQRAFEGRGLKAPIVLETPNADYRFRAIVPVEIVSSLMTEATHQAQDYPNFKNEVAEDWRHRLYMRLWVVMEREQQARTP